MNTPPLRIVTHPGRAHRDDFLACAILATMNQNRHIEIHRRDPLQEELDAPDVFVVDVGRKYEPANHNFDHHQFPADSEPCCSLSLVLRSAGLLQDMRHLYPWVRVTEILDCQGPTKTAEFLGIPAEAFSQTFSPVEEALLQCFSDTRIVRCTPLGQDIDRDWLGDALTAIGSEILVSAKATIEKLEWLRKNSDLVTLEGNLFAIFVERKDNIDNLERAMDMLRKELTMINPSKDIAVSITPASRGEGYTLYRYADHPRIDFRQIAAKSPSSQRLLEFVANSGFIAKTTTTLPKAVLVGLARSAILPAAA
jgi:hypothetical protein